MKAQFIRTDAGEELVILPRRDYDALLNAHTRGRGRVFDEDRETARIVRESSAAIAAGHEIELPAAIAEAIANGENPICALRRWRGRTQADLAAAVGVGQGHISALEAGKREGSTALLKRIAATLDVPLDAVVE